MVIALAERACQRRARCVELELRKRLNALATVTATAALVGLLGNAIGIINSFVGCAGSRSVCEAATASLIAQSFLTNAWGLLLAITSYLAHAHFTRRLDEFESEMAVATLDLLQALSNRRAFPA